MSTNCKVIGHIEQPLSPGDEVQPTFDISSWLGTDEISGIPVYSATDERGTDVTATVLTLAKHTNTTAVLKPWIKGGATSNKQYTVKMVPTTLNAEKKAFYIKYSVREIT